MAKSLIWIIKTIEKHQHHTNNEPEVITLDFKAQCFWVTQIVAPGGSGIAWELEGCQVVCLGSVRAVQMLQAWPRRGGFVYVSKGCGRGKQKLAIPQRVLDRPMLNRSTVLPVHNSSLCELQVYGSKL